MVAKAVAALVAVLLVAAAAADCAAAQAECDAGQLAVCAAAIISGAAPTAACCSSLRAQEGCFCEYAHNPTYARYINSPNARKTLTACGVAIPQC